MYHVYSQACQAYQLQFLHLAAHSSHQVRRKLHLKALAFTRADTSSGLRLPGSYEALPSAEDDDDLAAVALAGVGGGRDGTADELARIRAAAQQQEGVRDTEQQQQQGGEGGGQIVDHLPPANGAEDVYTLLKMYTVSSELVGLTWACPVVLVAHMHGLVLDAGLFVTCHGTSQYGSANVSRSACSHTSTLTTAVQDLVLSASLLLLQVRAVLRGQGEEEVDFPFRSVQLQTCVNCHNQYTRSVCSPADATTPSSSQHFPVCY